jgi:hypothetical protein
MYSLFCTKKHAFARKYRINNKLNYNFQLVLLFCFKMYAFVFG